MVECSVGCWNAVFVFVGFALLKIKLSCDACKDLKQNRRPAPVSQRPCACSASTFASIAEKSGLKRRKADRWDYIIPAIDTTLDFGTPACNLAARPLFKNDQIQVMLYTVSANVCSGSAKPCAKSFNARCTPTLETKQVLT